MDEIHLYDRTELTGELLARLSWTRRLAAGLVGDEQANDIAQEAWLAAVHRSPAASSDRMNSRCSSLVAHRAKQTATDRDGRIQNRPLAGSDENAARSFGDPGATDEKGLVEGVVPTLGLCDVQLLCDGLALPLAEPRVQLNAGTVEIAIDLEVGTLALAPPAGRAWPADGKLNIAVRPNGDARYESQRN